MKLSSGYRIFFHVSANVQFPSRVSIHLPTQSIDQVSSTCSFPSFFQSKRQTCGTFSVFFLTLISKFDERLISSILLQFFERISFHLRLSSSLLWIEKFCKVFHRGEIDRFSREESFGASRVRFSRNVNLHPSLILDCATPPTFLSFRSWSQKTFFLLLLLLLFLFLFLLEW